MTHFIDLIIDKLEANPSAKTVALDIDWQAHAATYGSTPDEVRRMSSAVDGLCHAGALKPRFRKGGMKEIDRVTIVDPAPLYAAAGRRPSSDLAAAASSILRADAEPWENDVIDAIEKTWSRHATWCGFAIDRATDILPLQRIARGFLQGLNEGLDMRTFSARLGGDSKFLERNESAIRSYIYHGRSKPDGKLRDILEANGTARISMPILLSGPFSFRECPLGDVLGYCGIPYDEVAEVKVHRRPSYVLTIENLVSFHRHVREVNGTRVGLILYTNGQPSRAFRELYTRLVSELGDVPFMHWSDIDEGGLEISKGLMSINPSLKPHLMTVELASAYGERKVSPLPCDGRYSGTWLEPLEEYLSVPGNKALEQEMIDPSAPELE